MAYTSIVDKQLLLSEMWSDRTAASMRQKRAICLCVSAPVVELCCLHPGYEIYSYSRPELST
jgi:hypothetical protein